MRFHKRSGRWPWKSESAKECVTTHLPNQLALKMDGAGASGPYPAVAGSRRGARGTGARGAGGLKEGKGGHPVPPPNPPPPPPPPADATPRRVGGPLR